MGQEVVVETSDVKEDGLVVKEEFGKQREVLYIELLVFTVDFVDGVVSVRIYHLSGGLGVSEFADFLAGK